MQSPADILWQAILNDPWDLPAWAAYSDELRECGFTHAADRIRDRDVFIERLAAQEIFCYVIGPNFLVAYIAVWCSLEWWLEHGPKQVKSDPIMWVRLTDRRPYLTFEDNWHWWSRSAYPLKDHMPEELPVAIWNLLKYNENKKLFPQSANNGYSSRTLARRDLSQALIQWAKSN